MLLGSTQYQKLRESLCMLNFSEVTQLRYSTCAHISVYGDQVVRVVDLTLGGCVCVWGAGGKSLGWEVV